MSEIQGNTYKAPVNFEGVTQIFSEIAGYSLDTAPPLDLDIGAIILEPALAKAVDLGSKVRGQALVDHNDGIVVILRPRNVFSSRRHGFSIRPVNRTDVDFREYELTHWNATKPKGVDGRDPQELIKGKQRIPSSELEAGFWLMLQARTADR